MAWGDWQSEVRREENNIKIMMYWREDDASDDFEMFYDVVFANGDSMDCGDDFSYAREIFDAAVATAKELG